MEFYLNETKKGMTFVEMLVVMAIISILFASFFYIWNTMDVFRKSRDSKRLNDLQLIDTALKTILTTERSINLGQENIIYTSLPDSSSTCSSYSLIPVYVPYSYRCQTSANYLKIDGNGWIPVDFTLGKILKISILPIDPLNNKDYFYAYQVKSGRYKLTARFESKVNISKMANDGGFEPTLYEVGSDLFIPSPQSGLVGYWNFDEGTGTIVRDLSGYNNNGTMYSSTTITDLHSASSCKIGSCANFDGVDDYIKINAITFLPYGNSPRSIIIWAFITSTSWFDNQNTIFEYGAASLRQAFGIDIQSNPNIKFYTWSDDLVVNSGLSTTTGWANLAFVYDGNLNIKAYINGNLKGSKNLGGQLNTPLSDVNIGRSLLINAYFDNKIDEIRIYNRALSDAEIKVLYQITQ